MLPVSGHNGSTPDAVKAGYGVEVTQKDEMSSFNVLCRGKASYPDVVHHDGAFLCLRMQNVSDVSIGLCLSSPTSNSSEARPSAFSSTDFG